MNSQVEWRTSCLNPGCPQGERAKSLPHDSLEFAVRSALWHVLRNARIDPPYVIGGDVFGAFPCRKIDFYCGSTPKGVLFVQAAAKLAQESIMTSGSLEKHEKIVARVSTELLRERLEELGYLSG